MKQNLCLIHDIFVMVFFSWVNFLIWSVTQLHKDMSEKENEWKLAVGDYCGAFNSNQLLNYKLRCRAFNTNVET